MQIYIKWDRAVYAGLAVAAVAGGVWLVQHLFVDDKLKKRKKDLPPALVNIGYTTCYCNTVLQCLAPFTSLQSWLHDLIKRGGAFPLHSEAYEMLRALNNNCDPDILLLSTEHLISLMQSSGQFQFFSEQDCQEFFQILCERLQITNAQLSRPNCSGIVSSFPVCNATSISKFPLSGRVSTRLCCSECGITSPLTVEPFVSLTLTVPFQAQANQRPTKNKLTSIASLLASFTADELLSDAVCEKCSRKNCLKKQTLILSPPPIICLHVSRSGWINECVTKRLDSIIFSEVLDITPFLRYKPTNGISSSFTYKLRSVIVHYGSKSSTGHFIAYRRSPSGRRWCYASDEEVYFVEKETVMSSEPYMLFYERSTETPPSNQNAVILP